MRPEDLDLLGDVGGRAPGQTSSTHEDKRLAGEVYVLFVFGDVASNRLVAELAQFDAYFFGCDRVCTVADDGPVAARRRERACSLGDLLAKLQHFAHRVGQGAQCLQQVAAVIGGAGAQHLGDCARDEGSCGNLRIERLRACHAHLNITAVGGVDDAVCLGGEFAAATVDDCDHACSARAGEVDGSVGVGGRAALADGDDQGVAHVELQTETRQLGGRQGVHTDTVVGELSQEVCKRPSRNGGGALADHPNALQGAVGELVDDLRRQLRLVEADCESRLLLGDAAAQRLGEASRCFVDLFGKEVTVLAAVDVARGDFSGEHVVLAECERRSIVGNQGHTGFIACARGLEHHHLTTARRSFRMRERLAVHAHVALRFFDEAVRLARDDETILCQADAKTLAASFQCQEQRVGLVCGCGSDGDGALECRNRLAKRLRQRVTLAYPARHESRNHLCVRRDRLGEAQIVACPQVGMVVDVTVECSHQVRRIRRCLQLFAVHRVSVGFGNDADARPARVTEHGDPGIGLAHCETQQVVGQHCRTHHAGVVAELADFGCRLVDERPRIARDTYRTGGKEIVVMSGTEQGRDAGVVSAQTVVPHHHVHAGRVASAHLETVESGECLLDGEVSTERRSARACTSEIVHGKCRSDAVFA